jgi:hypothetical protein
MPLPPQPWCLLWSLGNTGLCQAAPRDYSQAGLGGGVCFASQGPTFPHQGAPTRLAHSALIPEDSLEPRAAVTSLNSPSTDGGSRVLGSGGGAGDAPPAGPASCSCWVAMVTEQASLPPSPAPHPQTRPFQGPRLLGAMETVSRHPQWASSLAEPGGKQRSLPGSLLGARAGFLQGPCQREWTVDIGRRKSPPREPRDGDRPPCGRLVLGDPVVAFPNSPKFSAHPLFQANRLCTQC